jgi:hypothetical protein
MAITYETTHLSKNYTSNLSEALVNLKAIKESFEADGLSIMTEGITEVLNNSTHFNDYVSRLSEGMDPETQDAFMTIAENSRIAMLNEQTTGAGINPITALSLPMLRVAFPKTAIRESIPTEPVSAPKFKVTYYRSYIIDPVTQEKFYLPKGIKDRGDLLRLKPLQTTPIAVPATGLYKYDLMTPVGASKMMHDLIDPVFSIVGCTLVSGGKEAKVEGFDFRLDTNINVVEGKVTATIDGDDVECRIFAKVNREDGLMDVIGMGSATLKDVTVKGYLSSETNNRATQVGYDITATETTIGTGHPIEAPINLQQMQDTQAMYNIDTIAKHMEIMSTALAQGVDLRGLRFITELWEKSPMRHETSFDVKAPANYALGDTAWRDQIKIKIDHVISRLFNETYIEAGAVSIICNPIDAQILNNVRWTFSAGDGAQLNGVNAAYRVGAYTSGLTSYKVMSSFNIPQGAMWLVFNPSESEFKNVVYYPYSFNVIRGTTSPTTPNQPAIQMIKRDTFQSYTPMICKVSLLNNAVY